MAPESSLLSEILSLLLKAFVARLRFLLRPALHPLHSRLHRRRLSTVGHVRISHFQITYFGIDTSWLLASESKDQSVVSYRRMVHSPEWGIY